MTLNISQDPTAPTMRGYQLGDYPTAAVTHDIIPVIISSGGSSEVTIDDGIFDRFTTAEHWNGGFVDVVGFQDTVYTSLDEAVGTIGADGAISRVSAGTCPVLVTGVPRITLRIDLDLSTVTTAAEDVFNRPVVGSLLEDMTDAVDGRINSGMSMGTNGGLYSTQDHATPSYVRNSSLWCADVDLTCISPWNSRGENTRAGTLVTARHILVAAHFPLAVADTIRFIAADGTVHTRTVAAVEEHPDYSPYYPDLTICALDSDLPGTITPCAVMPASHTDNLKSFTEGRPPCLGLDQQEKALIVDWRGGGTFATPTDSDRLIFDEDKVGGDSGNPACAIINGALVLIAPWTFGGAGSGTPVADFIADLNTMIGDADTAAGDATGYTLTPADLSGFPTY